MVNNILKEKEQKYFNDIVTFIKSEYDKGFGTEDYDINSDSTNRLIEKLTPDANYYRDFDEDFKEGLKKLNATFIDLRKTALEQRLSFDELEDKTGLKNAQERIDDQLKRHSDYEAHPTMTQYVVNALKDFADWVCDIYCKHFGKDKNEAIPLLCSF
jgi:hypothetical protein